MSYLLSMLSVGVLIRDHLLINWLFSLKIFDFLIYSLIFYFCV